MLAVIIPLISLFLIVWALATVIHSMRRGTEIKTATNVTPSDIGNEPSPRSIALRDQLSKQSYGADVARKLWNRLMAEKPGRGLIVEFHRDFCGHGLISREDGVILTDIQDGGDYTGEPIATWTKERDFVSFFSRQSDFSCSGWDESEPIFFSTDDWYRNNQRLTLSAIKRYLES